MPRRTSGSIYFFIIYQRTEKENYVHCYLPHLTSGSTLLFLLLSAPGIINQEMRELNLSATLSSVLPNFSARVSRILARTCMWDKRPEIWKLTLAITHLSGHSPSGGQSLKGRALTHKSNAWGMEKEITAYVNAEALPVSDSTLWLALYFTSSPPISLLARKIHVRMKRFQPKNKYSLRLLTADHSVWTGLLQGRSPYTQQSTAIRIPES